MSLPSPARMYRLIALACCLLAVQPGPAHSPVAGWSIARVGTAAEAASATWVWPVAGPRRIIARYVAPPTPYAAGHRGIDIAASPGDEVRAPDGGVVHFAGIVVDRPVLSVRHPGGLISSVEPVDTALATGDRVARGAPIGTVAGGSAHCGTPCIHFGVRLHGDYVSPLNHLGGITRSVLLPTRPIA